MFDRKVMMVDNLSYLVRCKYGVNKLWAIDPVLLVSENESIIEWGANSLNDIPCALGLVAAADGLTNASIVTFSYPVHYGATVLLTLLWADFTRPELPIDEIYKLLF